MKDLTFAQKREILMRHGCSYQEACRQLGRNGGRKAAELRRARAQEKGYYLLRPAAAGNCSPQDLWHAARVRKDLQAIPESRRRRNEARS